MSNILQKTKAELGLTIIVIILSGVSASLVILPPLGIIPYATFRDVAIIPSVIAILLLEYYHVQNFHDSQVGYSKEWQQGQLHHLH